MRILHSSDLHGRVDQLIAELHRPDYDLWVDTGDFLPNRSPWIPELERSYQERYLTTASAGLGSLGSSIAEELTKALRGRPALMVAGNHDYISVARLLKDAGANAQNISVQGASAVAINGVTFAGFREIPYINGMWEGEAQDRLLKLIVDEVVELNPDVLVTHAPPYGILDSIPWGIHQRQSLGVKALSHALPHAFPKLKLHLFGHIHEFGNKTLVRDGITFSNAATCPVGRIIEFNCEAKNGHTKPH